MIKTVLIVDDSKIARKLIRKVLLELELEVIGEAVDGLDAIEQYNHLKPDLVLSDLEMPKLDGLGMLRSIKKIDIDSKIIILTSNINTIISAEILKYKCTLLKKPLKKAQLQDSIAILMK